MLKFIPVFCILFLLTWTASAERPSYYLVKEAEPLLLRLKNSKPDTSKAAVLLELSYHYLHRLERRAIDLDSAVFYAKAAENLSVKLGYFKGMGHAYLLLSWIFPQKNNFIQGKVYALKAVDIFQKHEDDILMAESYFSLAGSYSVLNEELNERIRLDQLSLYYFRKAGFKEKEGHVLKEIGDLYLLKDDLGQALGSLKHALRVYKSINYPHLQGIYDLLGRVYADLGSPREGLKYGLLAVSTAKQVHDTSLQQCTIYNRVGMTYFDLGEFEKAEKYYSHSLKIAEEFKDLESIYEVAANKAFTLIRLDRQSESLKLLNDIVKKYPVLSNKARMMVDPVFISALIQLKQNVKAEKYCDDLLEIASKSASNEEVLNKIYSIIIPFYLAARDYTKSAKYLPLHMALAKKSKYRKSEYANFLWQSRLDSARGNYVSAMSNYQKYSALKDSVFKETKILEISQLEVIYDIEKKDENIGLLTKQSQLQTGMLKQASLVQTITLVSIVMLLIILSLLYNGYRLNRKINHNMQVQQEEINRKNVSLSRLVIEKEWLIKEIHHRVKNNLHMVAGLLDSQSEFLKTDEAKMAITDSQHRIQSMSMIHQKLYQTENMSTIDISAYVHEMVAYLKDCYDSRQSIIFNLHVERVEMNISYSIPLGLILNEAITNSIKYAFPGDRGGIITIILEQTIPENFILSIADNGIGINNDFDIEKNSTFGLALIQGLCDDIDGKLEINSLNGTEIRISFVYQPEGHAESIA